MLRPLFTCEAADAKQWLVVSISRRLASLFTSPTGVWLPSVDVSAAHYWPIYFSFFSYVRCACVPSSPVIVLHFTTPHTHTESTNFSFHSQCDCCGSESKVRWFGVRWTCFILVSTLYTCNDSCFVCLFECKCRHHNVCSTRAVRRRTYNGNVSTKYTQNALDGVLLIPLCAFAFAHQIWLPHSKLLYVRMLWALIERRCVKVNTIKYMHQTFGINDDELNEFIFKFQCT